MMRRLTIALVLAFYSFCISCSGSLDKEDYVKWVRDYDHGLHSKVVIDPYVFDLQYLPPEYKWIQESHSGGEKFKSTQNSFQYYILRISFKDPSIDFIKGVSEDKKVWERRAYYFSYNFQDEIYLEQDGQRYPCVMFHFENAFDLRPERNFVLGFDAALSDQSTLLIDSPAFGDGLVKISISKKDIPTVDL